MDSKNLDTDLAMLNIFFNLCMLKICASTSGEFRAAASYAETLATLTRIIIAKADASTRVLVKILRRVLK